MDADWDDLKTVLHLVRGGSLSAAAAALGVNYTTVARRIGRAEAALGMVLFERLTDGYQPTDAGRTIAERAAVMEAEADGLLRQLQGTDQRLTGPLVITAPQLMISYILAPVLDKFTQTYPDVELRVSGANELLNLNRREADLAIRISRAPDESLKGLRLSGQDTASFASHGIAARIAADPTAMIDWLVYSAYGVVPKGVDPAYPNNRVRMLFDDMVAMQGMAQAGLGVVRMPMFLGRATPGLVQVPVLPPQPYADVWVLGHRDVWPGAKVVAFRTLLKAHFREVRGEFVA